MYPHFTRSLKFLLILTVLFPGVLLNLYSNTYEGSVVKECEREAHAFAASEKKYVADSNRLQTLYLVKGGIIDLVESNLEFGEYEEEKIQRPFECISSRIPGLRIDILENTLEYRNLKQCCGEKKIVQCDSSYSYRTIDGTCNNLLSVKWGSVNSCVKRLLPAFYEGVSGFRRSVCGIPLPNPRILSLKLFKNADKVSEDLNNIFLSFSQIVLHDIADTPRSTVDGKHLDCCNKRFQQHPRCAPICLPKNDPVFSKLNVTCLNLVRAPPCKSCSLGKRNIMSRPTSFIDCSFIYGQTEQEARGLMKHDGTGELLIQETNAGKLLSPNFKLGDQCGSVKKNEYCFLSGDERVNEQTLITTFQMLFTREHNRIAGVLKELNPHWDNEKLYQETRKITIAELQVIVYKEFLPLLLGSDYMSLYNLGVSNGWSVYNPLVDPSLTIEFNFGAYRIHSIIPTVITEIGVDGGKRNLSEFMAESAAPLYHGELENILHGMSLTGAGIMDRFMTRDITDAMLRRGKFPGIDLIAVDIQRARDVGMPPYAEIIRYLSGGKKVIRTFNDLATMFRPEDVQLLKSIYYDARDIDYYVGMHFENENRRKSGVIGGSLAEIVAKQFSDFKFGDRFFFEHFGNFDKAQLDALKKVSMATILCENTNLMFMQQNAMKFESVRNPVMLCKDIPKLNLQLWKVLPRRFEAKVDVDRKNYCY